MICPRCKSQNIKVLESRDTDWGLSIRRRRECDACKNRFTTFEKIETSNFVVIKKDNTREPYDRSKLEKGVWISCWKRPVTEEVISNMINELERGWSNEGKEIKSSQLGKDIVEKLKNIDEIAYIRFASVYRNFKDVEDFKEELVDFFTKK